MFVSEFPDEVRQHFFEHSCKVLTESCLSRLLLETRVMYAHPAKKIQLLGKSDISQSSIEVLEMVNLLFIHALPKR